MRKYTQGECEDAKEKQKQKFKDNHSSCLYAVIVNYLYYNGVNRNIFDKSQYR